MSTSEENPTNPLVRALLTDVYQLTMTYAHWKIGKHNEASVFELFFRKNPFKGEFTIFCGFDECLKHLKSFSFTQSDVEYLRSTPSLEHCEEGYFEYLLNLDTSNLKVRALQEGRIVFPRTPMIVIEGPLGLGQLLETTLLNLVNYPSLLATNAARMALRAKPAPCLEFGLRRAQGPDGACTASKYSYVGGFSSTSNVQAGKMFGIPISGTHAHAYVQAFSSLDEVRSLELLNRRKGEKEAFLPHVLKHRESDETNDGELAAFTAYACAFPDSCLCLIDTYDTLLSGLQNFISVALALDDLGYRPRGIRLDSGDLAALSFECRKKFMEIAESTERKVFDGLTIVASDDINEEILHQLSTRPHGITTFGIGTNLVTCQAQPALGCVYKLVEWEGKPRLKISQEITKVLIPGRKEVYRIIGKDRIPLLDYMTMDDEKAPTPGSRLTCRNPFNPQDRVQVVPTEVFNLLSLAFPDNPSHVPRSLTDTRNFVQEQLDAFPASLTRYNDPEPYRVMVSEELFKFFHELWEKESPMELIE